MCLEGSYETEPKLSEVDPVKAIAVMVGGNQVMVRAAIRDKWTKLCYLAHKAHDELERDRKLSTLLNTYVSPANIEHFVRALEKEGLEIVPKQRKAM